MLSDFLNATTRDVPICILHRRECGLYVDVELEKLWASDLDPLLPEPRVSAASMQMQPTIPVLFLLLGLHGSLRVVNASF